MKFFFSLAFLVFTTVLLAQTPEDIIKKSREFSMKSDLDNAILTLKTGMDNYPDNADIRIELAMAYYSVKRNAQALDVLQPLFANDQADEVAFQIAGLLFRSEQNPKEAEKTYKAGLKKFPNSGFLYHEYGQFMGTNQPGRGEDIKLWEKGIELDPRFAGNYYQACRYYAVANNTLWTLLYGEIFVNLDSYSSKTVEIKNILFQFYKKAFAFGFNGLNNKNEFENAVAKTLFNQKQLAASGLNPDNLSAIRTRFILEWFNGPLGEKYPFRLFERQQNMLREGMFDAYNQWLFGGAANLAAFQNWTKSHADEYQNFSKYQRQKLFVLNPGQYYR